MEDERYLERERVTPVEERVVPADETAQVAIMGSMLFSVPRVLAESVDALVTVAGIGETWRITQTIRAWEKHHSARYLLIAGQYENEIPLTLENLKNQPFGLRRTTGVHSQIYATNTKIQAEWIVGKVRELGITSLALYAPPYHLLRAYLTILHSFEYRFLRIPLIPVPLVISPDVVTQEYGVDAWEMATGEIKRTVEYQKKGDVATPAVLRAYLSWLWDNPFLKSVAEHS